MRLVEFARAVAIESAGELTPDGFLEDLVIVRGRQHWGDATPGWVWNGDVRGEPLTPDLRLEERYILVELVGHIPISCMFFPESLADLESRILSESGFFNSFTTMTFAFVDGALKRFQCFSLDERGTELPVLKRDQEESELPAVRRLRWL